MELNVNISPDAINKYVADQIIQSSLGETLRKHIDEKVKSIGGSYYDSPFKHTIEQFVSDTVREYLNANYKTLFQERIKTLLTADKLDELTKKAVDSLQIKGERY